MRWVYKNISLPVVMCLILTVPGEGQYTSNSSRENNRKLTVTFTGDIMLGRQVGRAIQRSGDLSLPFRHIYSMLSSADLTIGNLECVFADTLITGTFDQPKIRFPAYSETVQGLKLAGFACCSLANNHTMDFGRAGVQSTVETLEKNGIRSIGIVSPNPVLIKKNGFAIALFGVWMNGDGLWIVNPDTGYVSLSQNTLFGEITTAKKAHDIVIVFVHWGKEYRSYPDDSQICLARLAAHAGADLIIGHGPHQIQGIERCGKSLIAYSLGNCVFDQKYEETQTGLVLTVSIDSVKDLVDTDILPISIPEHSYIPEFVEGLNKKHILKELSMLSKKLLRAIK